MIYTASVNSILGESERTYHIRPLTHCVTISIYQQKLHINAEAGRWSVVRSPVKAKTEKFISVPCLVNSKGKTKQTNISMQTIISFL